MLSKKILEIESLQKSFGSFKAVDNISLHVNKGDIYGFLGPNGAGKSTTLRMMLGLVKPDHGKIFINKKNIAGRNRNFLNDIGALIEKPDFYKNLSALDNLKILFKMSQLQNENRIYEVLNEVNLWEKRNQKVGGYSQGMKQRLGIAQSLLHQPSLIILDEPSNGLDPQGQSDMRDLILRINKEMQITIIISSHILNEIEKIANRMVVINKGVKVLEGNVKNLMEKELQKVSFKTSSSDQLSHFFSQEGITYEVRSNYIIALIKEEKISYVIEKIVRRKINFSEVKHMRTLEELFLGLTT